MSILVRRSAADWRGFATCFTCPKYAPWQEFDAGHYKHGKLDFDLRNVNPQCTGCNRFWHGRLDVYSQNLIRKYGHTILDDLSEAAKIEPIKTTSDYQKIIKDLTDKISKL